MSILIVGAIFSMIVNERRREIGLLRAIGARAVSIFRLIMYESGILTGLGGVMGVVFGAGIVYLFNTMVKSTLRMPYLWPTTTEIAILVAVCVAAGIISGIVGTLYPAFMSSRMEPLRAIRLGE
jgi:putative ABC transport system permease protein